MAQITLLEDVPTSLGHMEAGVSTSALPDDEAAALVAAGRARAVGVPSAQARVLGAQGEGATLMVDDYELIISWAD